MPEMNAVMRGVIRTNVDLVAGGVGQVADGLVVGETEAAEDWFLVGQDNSTENGPYSVTPAGVWSRHAEMSEMAEFRYGTRILVGPGQVEAGDSEWYYAGPTNPTLGTALLDFKLRGWRTPLDAGAGLEKNGNKLQLPTRGGVQGTKTNPIITHDEKGIATAVQSGADAQTTLYEGLRAVYLAANALRIELGAILIPSVGILQFDDPVDKTNLSGLTVGWNYAYAYMSETGPAIELSPTVPDTPYRGGARLKTGDSTRRYIPNSAFYASGANTIRKPSKTRGFTRWILTQDAAPLRVVQGATNTTTVAVDISPVCPPTAVAVDVSGWLNNGDNSSTLYISAAGDGLQTVGVNSGAGQLAVGPHNAVSAVRMQNSGRIDLFGSASLHHHQSAVGASRSHHVDVRGYWEEV